MDMGTLLGALVGGLLGTVFVRWIMKKYKKKIVSASNFNYSFPSLTYPLAYK